MEMFGVGARVLDRESGQIGTVRAYFSSGYHEVQLDDGRVETRMGNSLAEVVKRPTAPIPMPVFAIGQTVYLLMAKENRPGMVTSYMVTPKEVLYNVSWGNATDTRHYDIELTTEYTPDYSAD